jgi:hypothetical protein
MKNVWHLIDDPHKLVRNFNITHETNLLIIRCLSSNFDQTLTIIYYYFEYNAPFLIIDNHIQQYKDTL